VHVTERAGDPVVPERDPFSIFPREVGDWSGRQAFLDPQIERVLGATDYLDMTYTTQMEGATVNLFMAYYDKQTEGIGHPLARGLPARRRLGDRQLRHPSGGHERHGFGTFNVNRAVIQQGLSEQLVYYWFEQRGRRITNDFAAKLTVVYDSIMIDRTDGAIVRFITPISPVEPEGAADERLQRMMREALPHIPRFIPE
jgi:EpsI family protein